jgi:hypothetical protein
MLTLAVRAPDVFGAIVRVTVLVPVPLDGAAVIQAGVPETLQVHVAVVAIATSTVPPAAVALWLVGFSANEQLDGGALAWLIVTTCPQSWRAVLAAPALAVTDSVEAASCPAASGGDGNPAVSGCRCPEHPAPLVTEISRLAPAAATLLKVRARRQTQGAGPGLGAGAGSGFGSDQGWAPGRVPAASALVSEEQQPPAG